MPAARRHVDPEVIFTGSVLLAAGSRSLLLVVADGSPLLRQVDAHRAAPGDQRH